MTKQQLRQHFLTQRKQLTFNELTTHSHAIAAQFFNFFNLGEIHNIHLFLPILSQREIDTWLIIKEIWKNYPQITTITSKTELSTGTMSSYLLTADTLIVENLWHVPEPMNAPLFADIDIDLIVMPLLCFDKQGNRVGYGKGCYDKFLTRCSPEIIKVGLSLFPPVATIDDVQPNDIKLDFCITPQTIWQSK